MRVDLFDFDLPEDRIALRPAEPRDAARMLAIPADGPLVDRTVGDLPALLRPGDALVLNDTRVIAARLRGRRIRAGREAGIEIMLHRRTGPALWLAFARPAKRLASGDMIHFIRSDGSSSTSDSSSLQAVVGEKREAGEVALTFDLAGPELDRAVELYGQTPLPPYIAGRRPADASDLVDYQTVYAREPGAVAAPTAGLHLTPALLEELQAAGIARHDVTLHVGAGTFLPVSADDTGGHRMHPEWGRIDASTAGALNATRERGGRVVAMGTTSLRLLESAAAEDGTIAAFEGETAIFITPGYRFRAVDALVTNFHLPRSTLFMLVSAFAGLDRMRHAYEHAIAAGYQFYSYGDACLIERTA